MEKLEIQSTNSNKETKDFENVLNPSNGVEPAFVKILHELIDDVLADFCFNVHRSMKLGYFPMQEYVLKDKDFELYKPSQENDSQAFNNSGCDIFGHYKGSTTNLCCPCCDKKLCSSRYAPHLYQCMGFGRRVQGKRKTTKRVDLDMFQSDHDDDYNSSDCNSSSRKRRRGKNTRRKVKGKNSDTFVPSAAEANYSEMTIETIRDCLSQMCGVISERTGRFCRNTLKCSMHVDDQRREVRDMLLGSSTDQPADDIHIDVDTVDESSHAQLWYTNRKTSKKNTMVVESSASAASTSSNKQEDYSSSLSKYASYS
ncbi:ataxin-7-like protein 3 isoform X2 [Argiope bruennichi]|uniref:ataxin-7-like protein 3 isoform X2 n=1 Tax=Argiope bruennichi TaxID=94029 RepID=UPI0024944FA2|nr:ataxin-7-like protein 3 isoform X2 [Argiope bruennichi]